MHKNQTSRKTSIQRKPNSTGLSKPVKNGMENLSGMDMPDVKVHYNSPKPAAVQPHTYTQRSDIHVTSGQAKQVAHKARHGVQERHKGVQPTTTVDGMGVNDYAELEGETDVMEAKYSSFG